ncbi:MAG: GWxTD domain-containing protein [Candidatus Krumholzibacteriota bacterium]|nr:GWxTD domain-containing protein [Candidatus Krumholzibacteriota bacterium]
MNSSMNRKQSLLFRGSVLIFSLYLCSSAAAEGFKGETALLKKITPPERLAYFGLQYELNQYQKKQYLSLPSEEERKKWMDLYWIEHDPTPATEENERRHEHVLRIKLARKLFGLKKAPGWDRRGEVLIRYGMPSTRSIVPADIGFYRMIPPGELWYYSSIDMLVAFQNFNLKGEFIYAFEQYGMSGREQADKLKAIAQFMAFSPTNIRVYTPTEDIEAIRGFNPDQIDYIADPDVRAETPRDLIAAIESEKAQESKNNFQKYLEEKPSIYSFELKEDPLPLFFDITTFHGGQGVIRTEFNFEVPTAEVKFERREGVLSAAVQLKVVVRDLKANLVAEAGDLIQASQKGGGVFQGPSHLPGQVIVALKPGYYRVGIEARDLTADRQGAYRTNLELPSMDDRLALSDIQFASSIKPVSGNPKFTKGDLQVVPHPLHAYRIPYPLTFYFEISGLDTDGAGMALYSVDYRIIPVSKKRKGLSLEDVPTVISSKFETTGFGSTQAQRLEIATENLWNGNFRLIVAVMDRRTRKTVEQGANFTILE